MKIEKINDNQIRCTLTKEDLETHHIQISELAYGTDKAKQLFRDMMQQAQMLFGFEADNIPLMIEAIPVSTESIVLIITKVEDPEELDTRFSKFSPYKGNDHKDTIQLDGADNIIDLILSVKPQLLLNFQLYRKSVSIPACLSWNHVALHCPISWNHILDNSGKYMSDMRLSVGCWRSVVKSICWSLFTVFHAFFKNVIVFPKLFNLFFPVYKVQVRIYFLIHRISSFCSSLRNV